MFASVGVMSHPLRRSHQLSEPTVARLPVYQRISREWQRRGNSRIDSETLGRLAGVAPATVRRDLLGLGPLGTRGAGYDVEHLLGRIEEALGHDLNYDVIVVGMGNLGRALVNSANFLMSGARLSALYDVDPAVIGTTIAGCEVQDFAGEIAPATLAVLCVPAKVVQEAADRLIEHEIRGALELRAPRLDGADRRRRSLRRLFHRNADPRLPPDQRHGSLGGGLLHTLGLTPPVAPRSA
jgi:redox-sensing transcriptional repressor